MYTSTNPTLHFLIYLNFQTINRKFNSLLNGMHWKFVILLSFIPIWSISWTICSAQIQHVYFNQGLWTMSLSILGVIILVVVVGAAVVTCQLVLFILRPQSQGCQPRFSAYSANSKRMLTRGQTFGLRLSQEKTPENCLVAVFSSVKRKTTQ